MTDEITAETRVCWARNLGADPNAASHAFLKAGVNWIPVCAKGDVHTVRRPPHFGAKYPSHPCGMCRNLIAALARQGGLMPNFNEDNPGYGDEPVMDHMALCPSDGMGHTTHSR